MSVIAWDGKTIAADRQATRGQNRETVSKLFRADDRTVIGFVGGADHGTLLGNWYVAGAKPRAFPQPVDEESSATLLVLKDDALFICFGEAPVLHPVHEAPAAFGSGGNLALGAMSFGATAAEAVVVACQHNVYCGMGIVTFQATTPPAPRTRRAKK